MIAAFTVEVLARGTALRLRYGQVAVLADMRLAPIQSSEVVDGIGTLLARGLHLIRGPIAAVAGSTLGKLQSERVLNAANCRTFLDMREAQVWIDSEMARISGQGGTA